MNLRKARTIALAWAALNLPLRGAAEPETGGAEPSEPRLIIQEEREVDVGTGQPPRGDRGFYGRKPGDQRPPFARPGGEPSRNPPSPGGGSDGRRPIDRLMEHLKTTAPEQYERLSSLRDSDPEAFRQELRVLFEEAAQRFGRGDGWKPDMPRRPDGEAGPRIPPPPRSGDGDRAFPRPGSPGDAARGDQRKPGKSGHPSHRPDVPPSGMSGSHDERIEQIHTWAAEYRQADASAKEGIRTRIRDTVKQVHIARERERTQRIEHMEAELIRLKEEMAARKDQTDALIDRAVEDILSKGP